MTQEAVSGQTPSASSGKVTIKSGVHVKQVPAGTTVGELRKQYGPMFRIPEDAKGYSGTTALNDNDVASEGMTIEFVKKAGEKG
jgi:hypothetical protein